MKIEGTYTFLAPQARVWEVFNTPQHLQEALPGCEKLEEREPGKFDVYLKIGIAAVKGSYKGKMEIADAEPPHRTRLIGEGKGLPGFVKGEALIQLTPQDQDTLISYQGDVQVGGLLAGVGQRMIGGVAKMLLEQFFKNMQKILKPAG
jgi:carbon monoxide dehydrogenase subunit G